MHLQSFTGRCYIPNDYFEGDELKHLTVDRDPQRIPNVQLKRYAEQMIRVADNLTIEAIGVLNLLPSECRGTVLSTWEIYQGITRFICTNSRYERRTSLPKIEIIRIALKSMYFPSLGSLYERSTPKELTIALSKSPY